MTPRARKKPVRLTKARQAMALDLLKSGGFVCNVADQIGVTRQALFELRRRDEEFRKAWDEAAEIGDGIQASLCEEEMDFRGRIGWLEPKFFEGRICGFIKKYSDALLVARMKALDPARYGDKTKVDVNGTVGVAGAVVVPGTMTPESWEGAAGQFDNLGPPPMPSDAAEEADSGEA